MPLSVTCSACGKRLKAKDELAGKVLPCPNCKAKVAIPQLEDEVGRYLLQDETHEEPASPAPSPPTTIEDEAVVTRRKSEARKPGKPDVAALPPLSSHEPPLWLRHLHWLLVLALLPLALSMLQSDEKVGF